MSRNLWIALIVLGLAAAFIVGYFGKYLLTSLAKRSALQIRIDNFKSITCTGCWMRLWPTMPWTAIASI